ncbi:hemolysin III [Bombiscardovia apis]|uniref:Hemolysin III n=1 Tax=Bombiscardovia apis TaxID=2932182 RepID=A0ABM8BC34_9BIFI|nr:hemolysin III family protein [Bombiscardovia apis]BDR54454.1 hemolysin III [Bombiscardovia apis]
MSQEPNESVDPLVAAKREQRRQELLSAREQAQIAREMHLKAKAAAVRTKAQARSTRIVEKAELKAAKIEGLPVEELERKVRLDVHGRPKPMLRGWIHAVATPLALASGIVLICISPGAGLKWACAVFMVCSLALFGNSALYHLGDWSPRVTDVLRRLDHVNIFLLIAGTYTPISFALDPFWRRIILIGIWSATVVVMFIHVIWISAPRWLYTSVYVIFGVAGVGFLDLFWKSPSAGPAVVWLLIAGGVCYIAGAVVYALRKPDPWPRIFGFHEIFHCGTVAGYACHVVAIYLVVCHLM